MEPSASQRPTPSPNPVREMRLVVTADDYEAAVRFYRDVLGLPERAAYASPDGRVVILEAGRATLEIADPGAGRVHRPGRGRAAGRRPHPGRLRGRRFRGDRRGALEAGGAELVAPATPTPWKTMNARLDGPAGLHLTLFSDAPPRPDDRTRPNRPRGRLRDADQTIRSDDVAAHDDRAMPRSRTPR